MTPKIGLNIIKFKYIYVYIFKYIYVYIFINERIKEDASILCYSEFHT